MVIKKQLNHIMLDNNTSVEGNPILILYKQMFHELYSIFIHDGGGHYYAYRKDFESGDRIRFKDSRVQ